MEQEILSKAQIWAKDNAFDASFREEIQGLIDAKNDDELTDRFYKDMEFGTGGMRGIIGAGSNRMNKYTIRKATQGLADYINQNPTGKEQESVAIAHDNRRFSVEFSRETASVLAANGIKVYLFPTLKPTPMLSYAVRQLGTTAGIVITASHNPPEYNGYKVSWADGSQVISPQDTGIINCVNAVEFSVIKTMDFDQAMNKGLVAWIGEDLDEKFYQELETRALGDTSLNEKLGVVYTPLHGTGNLPVREILKRRNFKQVTVVPEQAEPDPDFSTVEYPNPEEVKALDYALKTAGENDDLILANDPDADRIGALAKHQGEWQKLNGNQIGQLMLHYILDTSKSKNKLPKDGYYITTIVTSELGKKIAENYGLTCYETLTGFKYIGSITRKLENEGSGTFVFATEESHGYQIGDFVREKDGVGACMVLAELAAELKSKGETLIDQLEKIHQQFGYHADSLVNLVYPGHSGAMKIQSIMSNLRTEPPREIAGIKTVEVRDYKEQTRRDMLSDTTVTNTEQPVSNVLAFYMEDGSRITARPSGTEPKVKFYFNLCGSDAASLAEQSANYEKAFTELIDSFE